MSHAIVYLIRYGEKPEPEVGSLSAQGVKRLEALRGVFGTRIPIQHRLHHGRAPQGR